MTLSINCAECSMRTSELVRRLRRDLRLEPRTRRRRHVDAEEARALRLLAGHGLVPGLRYSRQA